jgi:hypothetical protein
MAPNIDSVLFFTFETNLGDRHGSVGNDRAHRMMGHGAAGGQSITPHPTGQCKWLGFSLYAAFLNLSLSSKGL